MSIYADLGLRPIINADATLAPGRLHHAPGRGGRHGRRRHSTSWTWICSNAAWVNGWPG
ncbi:MAG: hypothetical protein R2838_15320 [Caldilineaceae bacterium]